MTEKEREELFAVLTKRYVLIEKGRVWQLVGGLLGVLAIAGIVSYRGAMAALQSDVAERAKAHIVALDVEATRIVDGLRGQKGGLDVEVVKGTPSPATDDRESAASCSEGRSLVGCTCSSSFLNCDGARVSGNTCFAQNGRDGVSVVAYALCAKIGAAR